MSALTLFSDHGAHHYYDRHPWESSDDEFTSTEDEKDLDGISEVRDGIRDEVDLEGRPELARWKSSRSRKSLDPNLVSWDSDDDPASKVSSLSKSTAPLTLI